jgi:hypothetical protein
LRTARRLPDVRQAGRAALFLTSVKALYNFEFDICRRRLRDAQKPTLVFALSAGARR